MEVDVNKKIIRLNNRYLAYLKDFENCDNKTRIARTKKEIKFFMLIYFRTKNETIAEEAHVILTGLYSLFSFLVVAKSK